MYINTLTVQSILYIISAPSGTGKSSLIRAMLKTEPLYNAKISISHTTRAPRPGEINGEHYFFIDHNEFESMIYRGDFLEHARVFGHYYGTSRAFIEQMRTTGTNVFLDIDWQGAQQVRSSIPQTCSIFILPPSKKELIRRLYQRGKDNKITIAKRMKQAVSEMSHYKEYDYLIVNDNFDVALNKLKVIINAEHLRTNYQKQRYSSLIIQLLKN